MNRPGIFLCTFLTMCAMLPAHASSDSDPVISTFSIVAFDPSTGDLGVAVQSKYFSVGSVVPHARAQVGAVATQARGNIAYGSAGLELLGEGKDPEEVIEALISGDKYRDERQVAVITADGRAANFTGEKCLPWAGARKGKNFSAQGNLLEGPGVVEAMAAAFETADLDFASRLVAALAAGQAAGGDQRGRQSAALLVVRRDGGYAGANDRYIDLHVEDHVTPIRELRRLLRIRQGQLSAYAAESMLAQAANAAPGEARDALLARAVDAASRAAELTPNEDHAWLVLARVHLARGEKEPAGQAGARALVLSPAWRGLSPHSRAILGMSPEVLDQLLETQVFARLWETLPEGR